MDSAKFSQLDYILFVIVFILSIGIGLYYALKSRKIVTTVDDYLLGGRNMSLLPVIFSLAATTLTSATFMGLPAETYAYGTYTWIYTYDSVILAIIQSWILIPIFWDLKLTSVFEYFELRFNRHVRYLASGLYLFSGLFYLSLTVYVPALTLQQVTGVNTYVVVIVLSIICAIYTAIGGLRAVIWTDVVQYLLLLGSMVTIIVVGINSSKGINNVFDAALRGDRIIIINYKELNSRTSMWGHVFSTLLVSIYQHGLNQTYMQRYMSLSNLKRIRVSVWLHLVVYSIPMLLASLLGIVIYANYEDCDPFSSKIIRRIDQIVPHFIQDKASLFHGFNGIFIAGVLSASLSTTSSYLNAMSGVIYEDFLSNKYPTLRGIMAGRTLKMTVIILSIIQIGLVFIIEKMGSILQILAQCMALNSCALLTLFSLGIFIPKTNSKGVQIGALAGIGVIFILIIGSINARPEAMLTFRTDGCNLGTTEFANVANSTSFNVDEVDDVLWIFRINFQYYGLIGLVVGLSVGYTVSVFTGGNVVEDQRLIAKFLRRKHIRDEEIHLQELENTNLNN